MTRKSDVEEYCKWYLSNVKPRALARDIVSYATEHGQIGNNMYVHPNTLTGKLKANKDFGSKKNGNYHEWFLVANN